MANAENYKLYGRQVIYSSAEEFTPENIIAYVEKYAKQHNTNVKQMDYLYDYYKGKQDILDREKTVNDYITYKITENRAKEIVDFKTAYLVGDAIKYSSSSADYADTIDTFNDFCRLEGKETLDYDLIEWMNICGTAYRFVLPKESYEEGESPFEITTIDPRQCFVVYSTNISHKPIMGCYITTDEDKKTTYSVYVKNPNGIVFYEIKDRLILRNESYPLATLPIIEYPHGKTRMGAFEPVISLLNAINTLDSNRAEAVEQFVQSLLILVNCKMPDGMNASTIKAMGLIELISNGENKAEIKQLVSTLDQTNTQTLKEDMMSAVRTIVSMPNVSQENSGGDNGLAVLYRNGWEGAYESAMTDQKYIDKAEHQTIRAMLEICASTNTLEIPLNVVGIDYTRQHYENMATKSQVLIAMLGNDKIHPKTAFEVSGLFYDPNKKYLEGQEWYMEHGEGATQAASSEGGDTLAEGNEKREGKTWVEGYWKN